MKNLNSMDFENSTNHEKLCDYVFNIRIKQIQQ